MPRTKQNANLKKGKATQFKTGEKQAEIARRGGIASGKAKRKKKTLTEMARVFASLPVSEEQKKRLKTQGVSSEDMIHQMALVAAMFEAGENGSVRAAALVAEWLAEGNEEKGKGILSDILDAVKGVNND
jgi:hypothetical protein